MRPVFCILGAMKMRPGFAVLALLAAFWLAGCSDSSGTEYAFDREILEISVLRTCANSSSESDACYQIRYRYPIDTDDLTQFLVWIDTTYIDDTTSSVSKTAKNNPTLTIPYEERTSYYDTLDITDYMEAYSTYDSVQVVFWPEYSDDDDDAALTRVFVHFGDDLAPSVISLEDSVWATGAVFDWARPTDQTDYYAPEELDGPIAGYSIVVYAVNEEEDIRDVAITVTHAGETDSTGGTLYYRAHRFRTKNDSVWIDEVSATDPQYLRIAILDGEGFSDTDSLNRFRLALEGLTPESQYTIGITAYDSSGNYSGATSSVEDNQLFITTDNIAPVLGTKLYFMEDSTNEGYARLDSNNRVRIFWSMSVDPFYEDHEIESDTVVIIPDDCYAELCYRNVQTYTVDRWLDDSWTTLSEAGGEVEERYLDYYALSGDTLATSATGTFVTDTIRWVSPGDTLILRVRAIDSSGYYSTALVDTIYVTPGEYASDLDCPDGFVAVETVQSSDTSRFCMEKYEHMDDDGNFVTNVLYSEAVDACEAMSADGFTITLCGETDWKLVCLSSGGTSSYGVIEEEDVDASEYLYSYCNVGTDDSASAADLASRSYKCANETGVRDLPGQYQEWTTGNSSDTLEVLRGSSYQAFTGLDRETIALCTNRFFPYYTRLYYVKDTTVYIYRSGTVVDTSLTLDTSLTIYMTLTQDDFEDTLQFFAVVNPSTGDTLGYDYSTVEEYREGGDSWLEELQGDLEYVPHHTEVVFLMGGTTYYREVGAFYKHQSISFRCCAYPDE